MANTYTCLYYHIIFSTKNRHPWINPDIEQRVWEYLGGIARQHDMKALKVGGVEDHVHIVVSMRPPVAVSHAVQMFKGNSSRWIHETLPNLRAFSWQDGYGAFTVNKSQLPEVIEYVANQREHHRKRTFQEEYCAFLKMHGIEYDERYVWG
ncbi:MAG TPA: IS200/IS605 family transposase [Gemmataceae bacterium]|nr:IS200/IS605 family transposase [Gemmataceae bacterium]